MYNENEKIFESKDKLILLERCMERLGVPWGKIYRKSLIQNNNLKFVPNLKRMQDSIFNLYVFNASNKTMHINECVYDYRQFNESSCYKYSKDIDITAKKILDCIMEFMNINNLNNCFKEAYYVKAIKLIIEVVKLKYTQDKKEKKYFEKISEIKKLVKSQPYSEAIKYCNYKKLNNNYKIGYFLIRFKLINLLYLYYKLISIWKKVINF